jgi:DNA/RNA endonuclease YhcR with UshA esterase domain
MERRVMLAIATVLSFAGVLGLYFYSSSVQPIQVHIGDIGIRDVGSVVSTSGHIMSLSQTSGGDVILALVDYRNGASLTVYIPQNVFSSFEESDALIPGAEMKATGEVQEYQDEMELVVGSADDLRIIQYSSENNLTIEILAENPDLFIDLEVTVHGQIQNIAAEKLWAQDRLVDATIFQLRYSGKYSNYTMNCILFGEDITNDFHQGQLARFTGTFEYYEKEAKYRIVSDEMTLQS